jgi:GNAT superfamily N-acetyltransferase
MSIMANAIVVRDARHDEARSVMELTRLMMLDLELYGGRTPASDESAWDKIAVNIAEELKRNAAKYLFAETINGDTVGLAAAKIVVLGGAFEPKKTIHLSIVYVVPTYRRVGVGSKLLARALQWGRDAGCECCSLNVLTENPARSLYTKHGFSEVAINMTRPL